ncbi:hypothetical protein JL09_g6344 [Pichia kudriavzevii]|uniref:Uncharacterized protein n=1 Tax=Pichia kudriavzevii TaxID=4909 RepID=A0A099NR18_PICKU|nr:hypothetical protein JL09_g6344 [Pichia kudriavzevii]
MQLAFPQGPELQHATQTGKRVDQKPQRTPLAGYTVGPLIK